MDILTIILIVLTATLLIANIVMFATERMTTKYELNFDKSKVKIMLFASENEDEIIKEEIKMLKKILYIRFSDWQLRNKVRLYVYQSIYSGDKIVQDYEL